MDRVRVGVIGCGYWGPNLVRNFVELPRSEVVAVADLREDRLAHIRQRHPGIQITQDYRMLFSMGLEAVVVATPPVSHFEIARECLRHGLPVLVEKPLALNSRDAEELIAIARAQDLCLMVGHTFEYNPAVRALRDLIAKGDLGDLYYVDAVRANLGLYQRNSNVVWDLATHDVSILLYLLRTDPISVQALGRDFVFRGIHDIAYLHLVFPQRIVAHVHVSWLDPCKVRRVTIVGSRRMAVYDDVEPAEKIRIYDKGVEVPPYTDTYEEFHLSYRQGDVLIPRIDLTEPLRLECADFIEAVRNHVDPQCNGETALRVIRVLEAANRSLENGSLEPVLREEEVLDEVAAP